MRSFPMRFVPLVLAACAVLAPSAAAQCTVQNVTFRAHGAGCATVFAAVPVLSGTFDSRTCTLSLTLDGFGGCCNTFLSDKVVLLGVNPVSLPLPWAGCTLLVQPDAAVVIPRGQDTLRIALPPGVAAGTFHAQGVNHYFTTIGFTHDLNWSQGLAVAIG